MPVLVPDDYVKQVNDYVAAVDKLKALVQQKFIDLNKALQPEVTGANRVVQEAMEKLVPPPANPAIPVAAPKGLIKRAGETDDEFRKRTIEAQRRPGESDEDYQERTATLKDEPVVEEVEEETPSPRSGRGRGR